MHYFALPYMNALRNITVKSTNASSVSNWRKATFTALHTGIESFLETPSEGSSHKQWYIYGRNVHYFCKFQVFKLAVDHRTGFFFQFAPFSLSIVGKVNIRFGYTFCRRMVLTLTYANEGLMPPWTEINTYYFNPTNLELFVSLSLANVPFDSASPCVWNVYVVDVLDSIWLNHGGTLPFGDDGPGVFRLWMRAWGRCQ